MARTATNPKFSPAKKYAASINKLLAPGAKVKAIAEAFVALEDELGKLIGADKFNELVEAAKFPQDETL